MSLKAFLGKNDVKSAKTRQFALKNIVGFNALKTLGNVQTH